ncbi:hypothetical protein AVEN_111826-1 [Araneus ventricosus]|uniref:Uncharacterized protein n=1 Tax=Araneus ventricosus TaxID=182803 RepID=A0A4Y2JK81_ARAVE|nr:hypothetical protein AVEN_111826-1 [Araneus ventricosus]
MTQERTGFLGDLLLLDLRQPAYPLGCKALTRTAGEGESPQPPEDAEHPAPRQHLFLFKKGTKTPIGCESNKYNNQQKSHKQNYKNIEQYNTPN